MASKKRKNKSRVKKKKAVEASIRTGELVLIDSGPIRRKLNSSFKRARTYYEKAQQEWEVYQNEALPLYRDWLKHAEGALPGKIAELQHNVQRKSILLNEAEFMAMQYGIVNAEAFARMMDRLDHPDKYPSESDEDSDYNNPFEEGDDPSDEVNEPMDWDAYFKDYTMLASDKKAAEKFLKGRGNPLTFLRYIDKHFDLFFEEFSMEDIMLLAEKMCGHSSVEQEASASESGESAKQRLKRKYRALVKVLHPDSADVFDEQQHALWLDVQKAYKHGDEDFLDVVLAQTRLNAGEKGGSSCWDLSAGVRYYRSSLKALRRTLTREKKSAAWLCYKLTDAEREREANLLRKSLDREFRKVHRVAKDVDRAFTRMEKLRKRFDVETFRKEAREEFEEESAEDSFEDLDAIMSDIFSSARKPRAHRNPKNKSTPGDDSNQDIFDFF